jgi:hypothetical protein
VSEFQITLNNATTQETVYIRARSFASLPVSQWEVILKGIPRSIQGQEVTVNFVSLDIDNNQTFYTDSNGLEMQTRVFDYRPTWNFSTEEHVSGNYYPVNSAIAIVDPLKNLQMTVMNDRSQGGSVISKGRIELMQNRRLYYDDSRGVDEALNEKDQYGNGITVVATYHLEIFNRGKQSSYQRNTQLMVDEPVQQFFAFNYKKTEEPLPSNNFDSARLLKQDVSAAPVSLKYQMFPMARN